MANSVVGRVRFNLPSGVEWRVKANPTYAVYGCLVPSGMTVSRKIASSSRAS
jgi:hypothetical protein